MYTHTANKIKDFFTRLTDYGLRSINVIRQVGQVTVNFNRTLQIQSRHGRTLILLAVYNKFHKLTTIISQV